MGTEEKRGTHLEAAQMKFLRHLLGITKLNKEKNQCIREKTGAQNIVKEIKQYQKKWLNTYRGWTQTEYQNKHYNIDQKDQGTLDDRGRDGGTNFILRIKEQETHLNLHEHEDDDEVIPVVSMKIQVFWVMMLYWYIFTSNLEELATSVFRV